MPFVPPRPLLTKRGSTSLRPSRISIPPYIEDDFVTASSVPSSWKVESPSNTPPPWIPHLVAYNIGSPIPASPASQKLFSSTDNSFRANNARTSTTLKKEEELEKWFPTASPSSITNGKSGTVRASFASPKGPLVGMVAVTKRVGSVTSCALHGSARIDKEVPERRCPPSYEQDPGEGPSPLLKVRTNWELSISTHCPLFMRPFPPPLPLHSSGDQGIARVMLLPHLRSTTKPPWRK